MVSAALRKIKKSFPAGLFGAAIVFCSLTFSEEVSNRAWNAFGEVGVDFPMTYCGAVSNGQTLAWNFLTVSAGNVNAMPGIGLGLRGGAFVSPAKLLPWSTHSFLALGFYGVASFLAGTGAQGPNVLLQASLGPVIQILYFLRFGFGLGYGGLSQPLVSTTGSYSFQNLFWYFSAGLSFDVTKDLLMLADYRYADAPTSQNIRIIQHDIRLGIGLRLTRSRR